jgi:hypothetical protein
MNRLCIAILLFVVFAPIAAYGEPKKPAAQTKPSTRALRIMSEHAERETQVIQKLSSTRTKKSSKKTQGVLGGGLLDQGPAFNQSGPAAAGSPMTSGAPTSRGQVIK